VAEAFTSLRSSAVIDPLSRREDKLAGLHGNTQVPKLLGVLMQYIYTGDKAYGTAAQFFWDAVVNDHSYATGGHGRDEYLARRINLRNVLTDAQMKVATSTTC
jgi:DUF1680 family protein